MADRPRRGKVAWGPLSTQSIRVRARGRVVPTGLASKWLLTWDCALLRPRLDCSGPSGLRSACLPSPDRGGDPSASGVPQARGNIAWDETQRSPRNRRQHPMSPEGTVQDPARTALPCQTSPTRTYRPTALRLYAELPGTRPGMTRADGVPPGSRCRPARTARR
jgi:hypothetical protein